MTSTTTTIKMTIINETEESYVIFKGDEGFETVYGYKKISTRIIEEQEKIKHIQGA